jgi:hypothetical protein
MATKKKTKKKPVKKKPAPKQEGTAIVLHNVFSFVGKEMEAQSKVLIDLQEKVRVLQLTVDGVGRAVVENK